MQAFYWAILAAVVWGCVPIIEKIGLSKVPIYQSLFFRCLGTTLGIICLVIFKFNDVKNAITKIPSGWYYLTLAGFFAAFIGQIFFYNALRTGEVSKIAPIAGSFPLISFVLGVVLLGEAITISKLIGLLFVVFGVILLK